MKFLAAAVFALAPACTLAWAPTKIRHENRALHQMPLVSNKKLFVSPFKSSSAFDPLNLAEQNLESNPTAKNPLVLSGAVVTFAVLPTVLFPESASAAGAGNAIPSALAAYGHYVSILALIACTCYERFIIKPNMSDAEEDGIAIADSLLGVFGLVLVWTGYLRLTQYEKGWEFYAHEPFFWLKIALLGVYGASSFFNTTKIIQRSVAKRTGGDFQPMNEKLAKRMQQICNAELTALASIPLTATFMARGVGYSNSIPWQAEAAVDALIFGGLSFKYIKEAIQFEDGPLEPAEPDVAP